MLRRQLYNTLYYIQYVHVCVRTERKEHHHMHRATLIPLLAAIGTFILLMTLLTVGIVRLLFHFVYHTAR